jgi:hypothetical protein
MRTAARAALAGTDWLAINALKRDIVAELSHAPIDQGGHVNKTVIIDDNCRMLLPKKSEKSWICIRETSFSWNGGE